MAIIVNIVSKFNDRELKRAVRSLDDFKRAAAIAGGGVGGSMQVAGSALSSVGKQTSRVGAQLSQNVTLPLAFLGASAVKSAADFETSMKQVQVATGAPAKELKTLSDLALKMGADTIFSAGEASDAMLELAKAGMSSAQIEGGALKSTLDLAAASGMELADAAKVAGAGMNTFGLSAKDSQQIVDALAGAANSSAADVSDLALALQQTGQQAVASGLSLQETTGALAAFADAGIRGSDAGTSLKVFLQRLVPQSKEATEAMDELGVSFFDSNGNMKGMSEIAGQLQQAFKGMTQEQRLSYMQTVFGSDATRAANILYTEGAEGIQKYIDASTESGAASKMAQARMSGTAGALEQLRGSVETAAIKIGDALAPAVQDIAAKITDLTNRFTNLDPKTQQLIVKVGVLAAALGPVAFIGGKLLSTFGSMTSTVGLLITKVGAAGGVMPALGAAFTTLTGPVGLIVLAIAGVIAILVAMWRESEVFRNAVMGAFNAVKQAIVQAVTTIKASLAKNKEGIDGLKAAFKALGDFVGTYIIPLIKVYLVTAIKVVAGAIDFWLTALSKAVQFFKWVGGAIGDLIDWFKNFGSAVSSTLSNAMTNAKNIIGNALGWINDRFRSIFGGLSDFIKIAFSSVSGVIKNTLNDVIRLVNHAIKALNKINVTIPAGVPLVGGKTFGIDLPTIPMLAAGGIITEPTLAMVGEAGPEAVVPLSSRNATRAGFGNSITFGQGAVVVTVGAGADSFDVRQAVRDGIAEALSRVAQDTRRQRR